MKKNSNWTVPHENLSNDKQESDVCAYAMNLTLAIIFQAPNSRPTRKSVCLELVAKPHRHFLNVIMMQANWKKATNIPI